MTYLIVRNILFNGLERPVTNKQAGALILKMLLERGLLVSLFCLVFSSPEPKAHGELIGW